MGKGGRRLLTPTGGGKKDTVKERQEGTQEEKSHEDTAMERGKQKSNSGGGSSGKDYIGSLKPTRLRRPNYCGKRQRPRTTRQGGEKTPTGIQSSQTEDAPNRSPALERRRLAS